MNRLHQKLLTKGKAYQSWHNHPRHPFWHWTAFLSVAVLTFISLSSAITSTFSIQAVSTVHAAGNTYYVATTGSDSNTCAQAQNINSPKKTIKGGIGCMSGGDTLIIKGGTYNEAILSWITPIPNGLSWSLPTTIAGATGETVVIQPPAGQVAFWIQEGFVKKYLVIDHIVMDGQNMAYHGVKLSNGVQYVRVQNSEIKNSLYSGILVTICLGCTDPSSEPHV